MKQKKILKNLGKKENTLLQLNFHIYKTNFEGNILRKERRGKFGLSVIKRINNYLT